MKSPVGQGKAHRRMLRFAERHGWTCHICGLPVPKDVEIGSLLAPTRDHVMPREFLGKGRGVPNNRRLAHAYCNSVRASHPLTDARRARLRSKARDLLAALESEAA